MSYSLKRALADLTASMKKALKRNKSHKLTKENLRKWITALRSGKYTQGQDELKYATKYDEATGEVPKAYAYCCLGVLREVCPEFRANDNLTTLSRRDFPSPISRELITMNDTRRWSFKTIANFLEKAVLPFAPGE